MYDKETLKACIEIVKKRAHEVREFRNQYHRTKGHAIFSHPFTGKSEGQCKYFCDNLFDMMQEGYEQLTHVQGAMEALSENAADSDTIVFLKEEQKLSAFLKDKFPEEWEAAEGKMTTADLTIALVNQFKAKKEKATK